jgi:hypothetical protein
LKSGPAPWGRSHFPAARTTASGAAVGPVVQLVNANLAAKRITMNTEESRGAGLIAIGTVEHALDKFFLELVYRFFKQNASLDHLAY